MSRATMADPGRLLRFARLLAGIGLAIALISGGTDRALAQSASAGLTGTVVDSTGAVVSDAMVTATHEATSTRRQTQSAIDGSFTLTTLVPGRYVVRVTHPGFQPTELHGIVLNVDDRLALRIDLSIAGLGEEVTVVGEPPRINTSPAVSTVIDRKFVENLPLNGRSFQALLQLTPGVVLTTANTGLEGGQFAVNGQRTSENYFTVDGVSANAAAPVSGVAQPGAAGSGQLPTMTALGGTNGLVSVDALQEFRVQTSSYAPEFGRSAGGQVSLVTRSGTNEFHGSAFEYFRDDALDATDWFVNRDGAEKAPLKQHNFGGVLGGPVLRKRLFAFGSYERLRLLLPQTKTAAVPTLALRQSAAPALQPFVNALPQPNGVDLGNGFAQFLAVYSDPSALHSTSVRIDHTATNALRLFGRISDAPSSSETRVESYGWANALKVRSRAGTVGSTWVISDRLVHDLRANITFTNAQRIDRQVPIGGAPPLSLNPPSGRDPARTWVGFNVLGGGAAGSPFQSGPSVDYPQRQVNVVGSLTRTTVAHELKAGYDYRWTSLTTRGGMGSEFYFVDPSGLRTGLLTQASIAFGHPDDRTVAFDNLSIYAQDHWRTTSRLTLTYGTRWELMPPPHVTSGVEGVTLDRTDDLYNGQVRLAPQGTELWKTRYTNVAPRVGASYIVSDDADRPLVLRSGFGVFYGLGYGQAANAFGVSYPFSASRSLTNVPFPLSADLLVPPTFGVSAPRTLWVMDRNIRSPYTLEWNISADQGLGRHRTLSISYVGADSRRLLKVNRYRLRLAEWPTSDVIVQLSQNLGYSDYEALQVQFQQRLREGLQAVVSYTLSRSRDTGSSDATSSVPAERLPVALNYGYSNFDVRHVLSAALTYQPPEPVGPRVWRMLARDWGLDLMIRSRSGFPLILVTSVPFPPDNESARPNVVPGEPFWLDDPTAPGGRRLNRQAFAAPPAQTQGDLPRGAIRGFGLTQVDLALRREFRVIQPVRLQVRAEAFNLFNTPHFADPVGTVTSQLFGVSTQMLGRSLGGLNPLYQMGGPRSVQLAAKVLF